MAMLSPQTSTQRSHPVGAKHWVVVLGLLLAYFAEETRLPEVRFQQTLDALREEYGLPGATAAYALPDGTVGAAVSGWADREGRVSMPPDARMLAASVGKTFVGALTLALTRDGVLDLDVPVSEWLGDRPWFARVPNTEAITLRHLLTHSAGLPDHVSAEPFARAYRERWSGPPFEPEALIAFVLDEPPLFAPGEGWYYSDTGYLLVGLVIEEATGRDYYELATERFLRPLGLDRTSPSDRRALPGLVTGYVAPGNPFGFPTETTVRPGVMAWDPAVEWTGGGMVSTSADLAAWGRALFSGRAMPGPYLPELLDGVPVRPDTRYGVAVVFQVNTDVGMAEGNPAPFEEMARRLAEAVLADRTPLSPKPENDASR